MTEYAPEWNNTFKEMMVSVYEVNKRNGWYDNRRTLGDDIALLHTEVSEAFEAYRKHGIKDVTVDKPEGFGSELADVLIRLLDTSYRYNIDLVSEFNRKLKFNATRGYRHGGRRV